MQKHSIAFRKEVLDIITPGQKRLFVADPKTLGLKLAVYESGTKTFILQRKVNGRSQRIKIGSYRNLSIEQARKKAKDLNARIDLGGDPHKDVMKEKKALTFQELYDLYYHNHAVKYTKRPYENKKTIEHHVLPLFGNQKAALININHIKDLYYKIGEKISIYSKSNEQKKSYGNANRVISIINAIFNYGIKESFLDIKNPCFGLKKHKDLSRDRFLNLDELDKFIEAIELEEQLYCDFFKILLYTGARKSNVLSMKWDEIDLKLKCWRISEANTKNKEVNVVVLPEVAISVLNKRYEDNFAQVIPSKYIFPGNSKKGHLYDAKKSFNRIKTRMDVYNIRIHDLRRTLASYMAISGASLHIIGKALNHKSQDSTAIYARLSNDPVFAAVNLATHIMLKKSLSN